jgi:hypothetical protein
MSVTAAPRVDAPGFREHADWALPSDTLEFVDRSGRLQPLRELSALITPRT